MYVKSSDDSDSQLGTTPVVSGARRDSNIGLYSPTRPKRPPPLERIKADIIQIDLTKEVSHCGTVEVGLECAGETSAVDRKGPFHLYIKLHLIEVRKILSLPNHDHPCRLEFTTVPMYRALTTGLVSLSAPCRGRHCRTSA